MSFQNSRKDCHGIVLVVFCGLISQTEASLSLSKLASLVHGYDAFFVQK